MTLIAAIGLRCGRGFARLLLYPITLYFYLRRPYERRVSKAFLTRISGRPATALEVFRHIHRFAATLLDRMFLLGGQEHRFDVRVHGLEELTSRMRPDRGVLLLGAHVGSFEVLRVAPRACPGVELRVVLDVQKTPALTGLLHALDPAIGRNVIDASQPGTDVVLAMSEGLARGALVALLADRARPHERTVEAEFLGAPAPFPAAPFLLGPMLGVPVVLCLGLYRGGNRYDVHFEAFAEAGAPLPRGERAAALQALVSRYAQRLEHHVRADPCNWFNWHDFWNPQGTGQPAPADVGRGVAGVRVGGDPA
ncbi:MAG: acyltransferase [Xanthomonadales bacterium]|nr:acyltransferase [Xanthomonadales bacterium]